MKRVAGCTGEEWDSHVLLLYRDEAHRQASVVSWVRRGLERGEKILYSTVPSDTAALMPVLRLGGVDVERVVRDGQFCFLPLEEFFPGAGQAALVHHALDEGYPGVRLAAQADAALSYLGKDEYQAIDRLMDELCANLPVSALCQYDAGSSGMNLTTVIDSHLDAVQDVSMRLRRREDGVLVVGELDLSSAEFLTQALHNICQLHRATDVVIDLSELTFVDVSGCRALAAGTETLRRDGGTVFLRGVNGHIRKVMLLLGMDRLTGVELV